jgi:tetratricopeptide (TPR) repeat protein/tRNA A-37 threonylcarbamoyl transferase component Bud32
MALDPRRVKALFNAALDLPDPADRPAFLDRECGSDIELRQRLEELLAAYDQPASALERPLAVDPCEASSPDEPPAVTGEAPAAVPGPTASFRVADLPPDPVIGTIIAGRYKLRQEIGEGGMGSVYLAEQMQPVKRHVALKLIKPGMDSRTVLARFESERQALALMDHPNIARVLDAGATDDGRPFFVMELVKGIPLTDYCDQHRLGLPERLALFRQICSAVQHAHQKGIIHRDLKPRNILVESHDGHPVPKVIDFGLAKATSGLQLTEQSLFTAFGTVAGTPLYMAPEQASFNALDIDTRADIYALGVILYELLTGSTPIRRETIKQAALDEILRVIREVEPPTPSSRISTSEALPAIAATRQTEPARLGRFVRGDLDWIVMKALAKERQRRYESAIALAQDLERFTSHEPVSAGPPTAGYRLRKFVRRNRPQVVAASLLLLALVAGMVGTTLGLLEARRQERIAVAQSREKERALLAEALQRGQAERRLTQIEKANEILGSIFKDLDPRNPEQEGKPLSALLGERLDQATAQIEGEAIGDPLTVARMQMTLGDSLRGLGYAEKAIALYTKARATFAARLGPDHPDTLKSMDNLALGYHAAGKLDLEVQLLEETLARSRFKLGPDHPDTLTAMDRLAWGYHGAGKFHRALPLWEETLALRKAKLGPDHRDTISSMNILAVGYENAGKNDRALALYKETLEKARRGSDHLLTVTIMGNLAPFYNFVGQFDRGLPLYEESVALSKSKLGSDHFKTLQHMRSLAFAYGKAGKSDRTLPLLEELLALKKAKFGPGHPATLGGMHDLACSYRDAGQLDRALPLFEETLVLRKVKLGPDHPDTVDTMDELARAYQAADKLDRALPLLEQALELRKAKLGHYHWKTLLNMRDLARAYQAAGKSDRVLPLLEEALRLRQAEFGPDDPPALVAMHDLACGYRDAGQLDRALPLFEKTLALRKVKLGPDHPYTLDTMTELALAYQAADKLDRALPLLEQALELRKAKLDPDHPRIIWNMNHLAMGYLAAGKWTEAETILRELLTLGEAKAPDTWSTFDTKSRLGGALLGQGKYEAAEPLLRAGYEGMKLRAEKIPPQGKPRLAEALDRLIKLAEATNRPDDARMWKDERAKLPAASAPKPGAENP